MKRVGKPGFAGLLPNAAGRVPELKDPALVAAAAAFSRTGKVATLRFDELDDDEVRGSPAELARLQDEIAASMGGVWAPPLRRAQVSEWAEQEARGALRRISRPPAAPPSDSSANVVSPPASSAAPRGRGRGPRPRPPPPRPLLNGGPLAETRAALPVAGHRDALLAALRSRVSIIEGETGSGKTTQVAQYVLEEAAANGEVVNILCTQVGDWGSIALRLHTILLSPTHYCLLLSPTCLQ